MTKHPILPASSFTPADLSWFQGTWIGQHGTDQIEEDWSDPAGNALTGMFRWIHAGHVRFYELCTIEPNGAEVILRIKHFSPGLIGWEEKDHSVEFLLVRQSDHTAVFYQQNVERPKWMIYRLEEPNTLIAYFEIEDEAVADADKFIYSRQRA